MSDERDGLETEEAAADLDPTESEAESVRGGLDMSVLWTPSSEYEERKIKKATPKQPSV